MKQFVVGGAIRDVLLGTTPNDIDFVWVETDPTYLESLGMTRVGADFPVFIDIYGNEHALARTERKVGNKYTDFLVCTDSTVTIEEDLCRRDVGFNSLAVNTHDWEEFKYTKNISLVIDPWGGVNDIQQRRIRHTSVAFREDVIRVLRICRFASRFHSLGFTIAPETMQLMKEMVAAGDVDYLTKERVWREIEKTITGPNSRIFFEVLHECGALKVLMPELDVLWGIPQTAIHHPEVDTGIHTMMVLDMAEQLTECPQTRFAALVHDLGKGTTPVDILPKHHGHEERGRELVSALCKRMQVPNLFKEIAMIVAVEHVAIHRAMELRPGTIVDLLTRIKAWGDYDRLYEILIACEADARGRLGMTEKKYPQAEFLLRAVELTRFVDANQFIEKGLVGKQIGDAIRQERAQRIAKFKETYEPM